jgi:hypothetical protein
MRVQSLIAVRDVGSESRRYQELLGVRGHTTSRLSLGDGLLHRFGGRG